jgi:hypothetical protein
MVQKYLFESKTHLFLIYFHLFYVYFSSISHLFHLFLVYFYLFGAKFLICYGSILCEHSRLYQSGVSTRESSTDHAQPQ